MQLVEQKQTIRRIVGGGETMGEHRADSKQRWLAIVQHVPNAPNNVRQSHYTTHQTPIQSHCQSPTTTLIKKQIINTSPTEPHSLQRSILSAIVVCVLFSIFV